MSCDCGSGCCPSSNPLWVKVLDLKKAVKDSKNVDFYLFREITLLIEEKMNELINKHNILVENDTTENIGFNQILSRLIKLENANKRGKQS